MTTGIQFINAVGKVAVPEQNTLAVPGDDLLIGQFALCFRRIIIAVHRNYRRDSAELIEDGQLADITGMQEQVNTLKDGKERWR